MRHTPRAGADAVRSVMRLLHEGARATPELLATISDRSVVTIRRWAKTEGWDSGSQTPRQARVRRLIDRITATAEGINFEGNPDAITEAKEIIRACAHLVALLERLAAVAGAAEARMGAKERDEQIASVLGKLNRRIVELAQEYAGDLAARGQEPAMVRGEFQ